MLKKLISKKDVQELHIGDVLLDQPETAKAKSFTVENISDGIVYAIYEHGYRLLKIILTSKAPEDDWWLIE